MTRHVLGLLALSIIAIAVWAYNVNYSTLTTLDRIDELRADIASEREAIQVLRIEWAYLNQPDRLARLVEKYSEELQLVPVTPEVLQQVATVPFVPTTPPAGAGPDNPGFPIPAPRPVGWRPE